MIDYDDLQQYFARIAPRIPENRRIDWLENAEIIIDNNIRRAEFGLTENEIQNRIESKLYGMVKDFAGFNAYDMGPLYSNYVGDFSQTSAADIVNKKLATSYPEPEGRTRKIAQEHKAYARQLFGELYGDSFPEEFKFARIAVDEMFQGADVAWDEHPWITKPYLDNLVIAIDKNGYSHLIDFVSPRTEESFDSLHDNVTDSRKARLAFIKVVIEEALHRKYADDPSVKKTIDRVGIFAWSYTADKEFLKEVDIDPSMEMTTLYAGDHYWDCVLKEEIPKFESPYEFEYWPEVPTDFGKAAGKFVMLKKLESFLKKKIDSAKNSLNEIAVLRGVDFETEGKKTRAASIDFVNKVSKKLNTEKLLEHFVELGGDRDADIIYESSIKPKITQIKKFLKEKDVDPKDLVIPGTSKADPHAYVAKYKELGGDMTNDLYFQFDRKLDLEALKVAYRALGGDLNSDKVTDKSTTSTTQLVRAKDIGHQPIQDAMSELAEEAYSGILEMGQEITMEYLQINDAATEKGRVPKIEDMPRITEPANLADVDISDKSKEKFGLGETSTAEKSEKISEAQTKPVKVDEEFEF